MERYFVFWRTVVSNRRAYAESNPYPGEDEIYYFNNIAFTTIQVHVHTHIYTDTCAHRRTNVRQLLSSLCPTDGNDFEYLGQVVPVVC